MRKIEKQGEDDFYRGKDPGDNPYQRNTEQAKEWQQGNDDAFYEYRKRHKDWYGDWQA